MNNVVTVANRKCLTMLLGILSVFKRLLCFLNIRRRRRNSGAPILPLNKDNITVPQSVPSMDASAFSPPPPPPPQSLENPAEELEAWDTWGVEAREQDPSQNSSMQHNNAVNAQDAESEPELDFFQDMQPSFRKAKKILIRKKEEYNPGGGFSSRLAMATDIPMVTNELETWEDNGESAWAEEAEEDHSWEAEKILKDRKRKEREQRLQEHHRKNVERSSAASSAASHRPVQLSAVRLS